MSYRFLLVAAAFAAAIPAVRAVDPSELKPGLAALYQESGNSPLSISRVEPGVALTLGTGEAAHPRLKGFGSAKWVGAINIVRPGKYAFAATVQGGTLRVTVHGKPVLIATAEGKEAATVDGGEMALEGGVQPFEAAFTAAGNGPVRVELRWQGPGFRKEPVPYMFFGHLPKDRPAHFEKDTQLELGRFRFEELACVRCHKPASDDAMAKGLADRPAPNLTDVGKRSYAGWIDAWLADPAKLRPNTVMPKMFADDAQGQAERFAVVKYLVSLAGTPLDSRRPPALSGDYRQSMERGRVLFTVAGCAACHADPQPKKPRDDEDEREPLKPEDYVYSLGTNGSTSKYNLGALGSKYRPETLAAFLQNPLKVNPAGRMPHMNLEAREATDIARYLCRVTDETLEPALPAGKDLKPATIADRVFAASGAKPAERQSFDNLPLDAQWIDLGRKLMVTKGCVNCHAIEPGGKAVPATAAFPSLDTVKKAGADHGCLSAKPDPEKVPVYKFGERETAAVGAFLKDGLTGAGSPSPTHSARVTLRRFNCLNCHGRDGEGDIPTSLSDQMRLLVKAENADDVRPPLLTGIGHKSRTSWLKSVLLQSGRARPWMQLRMPQYGEANVGRLPEALPSLEGTTPDDSLHKVELTAAKIAAGKAIIGKNGLGCISCHDIAGIPNSGTRGPDLATINQRVRYEWYERWLHQPMRMAPGTRMPQAFVGDQSTLTTILNGNAAAQAEAMWAYLSLGPGLPLPEGMEPPKGLIVSVKDRPEVLRTFMSDAGNKAVAVGYPGGVSVVFSADTCRLAYGWAGNFLDASPVWNNRGGAPAKLLGPKFWTGPAGHPWGLTANPQVPPDFAAREKNPAFGAPLPFEPAVLYTGPRAVRFFGYTLDSSGQPTFRYMLTENEKGAVLSASETPVPLTGGIASGLSRRFEVELPGGYQTWFLAGYAKKEPRAVKAGGAAVTLAVDKPEQDIPTTGIRIVLPTDNDRATVLEAPDAPAGTTWRLVKSGDRWQAILRLPETKEPLKASLTLNLWGLPKDDEALLKGLPIK